MEKYWSVFNNFEKDRLSTSHILDSKTREHLNMMYSSPITLPIPPHLERPPSPVDAIEQGCNFLTREYQKGFLPKFDAENYKKTLLRPALLAKAQHKMIQKSTLNFDLEKLYENEKYQKFWLTSNTVLKIKKEISKLPFFSPSDIQVVIGRFLEFVSLIVRTMKHKNLIDNEEKQNKMQLRATMMHFINEAKVARKKAFRYAFQQEFLDLDKLDDLYKEEFKDDIPKYSRQQNRDDQGLKNISNFVCSIDEKMIEHLSLNCENLPKSYKMTNYLINEDQRSNTKKELKQYISNLPQHFLNGINQIELQKVQSAPIINSSSINRNLKSTDDDHDNIDEFNFSHKENSKKYDQNTQNSDSDLLNSCDIKNEKKIPIIITIPFKRKNDISTVDSRIISNPIPQANQDVQYDYWNSFDPLDNVREGNKEFESISQIRKIASSFKGQYENKKELDITLPFKLEYDEIIESKNQKVSSKPSIKQNYKKARKKTIISNNEDEKAKGPTLIGDIWTTSDLLNNVNNENEDYEEDEYEILSQNNEIFNKPDGFHQLTLESEKRNNDAKEYLKSFKNSKSTKKSNLIVTKLQDIWEKLGFTIQQKISLLVKYTNSAEESQKLNDALNFWEMTLRIVSRYNKSYQNLKDFIKLEAPTSKNAKAACEMHKQQVEMCEDNVKQIAENLMSTFGDELIINRKKIQQIIPKRHKKMMDMINLYCED